MEDLVPKPPLSAGQMLGEFRIVGELGRGGMGVVYEAEQTSLQRHVALKVLPAHLTLDERTIERFQREARSAARLRHQGIVEIYAVGEQSGTYFFAMELVEGTSLGRMINRIRNGQFDALPGAMPGARGAADSLPTPRVAMADAARDPITATWNKPYIESVVKLVASVADALDYAHKAGIIHRDVKPANILLRRDGTPALTDFGIAREEGLPSLTRTGEFAGTPFYVSPEQAMARRMKLDHRTDIFSLGATLYELLTLRWPFPGRTTQEVLGRILTKEPIDPQRHNPRLAPDLVTILLKALEKDPDRRYATAGAMAVDLRAFLEYRPIAARRASMATRVRRFAQREPAKAMLIGVLLLGIPVVAGLGGWTIAKAPEVRAAAQQRLRDRVEAHLEEGFLELGEGTTEAAIAALEAALALDPRVTEAVAGIALAHVSAGRASEALGILDRRGASVSDPLALNRIRVDVLHALGRLEEAHELAVKLGPPRGALAFYLEARREMSRGEKGDLAAWPRALTLLNRACLTTSSPRALFHYERAHVAGHALDEVAAHESADAIQALWPGSATGWFWIAFAQDKDRPLRIAAYRRAISLRPRHASTHANLGMALEESGDAGAAMEEYRRAIEIDPEHFGAHYCLGNSLRKSGDLPQAIEEYRRAVEIGPRDIPARNALAVSIAESGDFPRAIEEYRRALEIDPGVAVVHYDLGNALWRMGDSPGAMDEYRRAIEIDPGHFNAHLSLAGALDATGSRQPAIEEYRRAIEIDPMHVQAHLALGVALAASGDRLQAMREYRRVLEIEPRNAPAHNDLGAALLDSGDRQGAIDGFRRALEAEPGFLLAHRNLALALTGSGDRQGAIEEFRRALEIDPGDALVLEGLSRALADSGDLAGAREVYERWVRDLPDDVQGWASLAWFLVDPQAGPRQRDATAALTAARRAVELSKGTDARVLDTLAEALLANGDATGAVETEKRALAVLDSAGGADAEIRPALEASLARFRLAVENGGLHASERADTKQDRP